MCVGQCFIRHGVSFHSNKLLSTMHFYISLYIHTTLAAVYMWNLLNSYNKFSKEPPTPKKIINKKKWYIKNILTILDPTGWWKRPAIQLFWVWNKNMGITPQSYSILDLLHSFALCNWSCTLLWWRIAMYGTWHTTKSSLYHWMIYYRQCVCNSSAIFTADYL